MVPYKVYIAHEVFSLARPANRDRDRIISFLEILCLNPFEKVDYEENDDIGRTVQIKVLGHYALTFWADHAVREVKVTSIEKADSR